MEQQDGKGVFLEEHWSRTGGGGGRNRIFKNANIIEKGHVHFTELHGHLPDIIAEELIVEKHHEFFSTGITAIMYPFHPHIPSIYLDLQYFQISTGKNWFTAGIQLMPCYTDDQQELIFQSALQNICNDFNSATYTELCKNASEQFYLPHRKEKLGIDGLFLEKFSENGDMSIENYFTLIQDIGDVFLPVYTQIIDSAKTLPVDKNALSFLSFRRSRMAEYFLLYDNRFRFGLESGENAEVLFHMLPPESKWSAGFSIEPGSKEQNAMRYLS